MYVCNVLQNLSKKQMLHIPVERQHLFENIKLQVFLYITFYTNQLENYLFPPFSDCTSNFFMVISDSRYLLFSSTGDILDAINNPFSFCACISPHFAIFL